jgi:transcription initiation factor IIF auxiliary subunit
VSAANTAREEPGRPGWWLWTVFIEGPEEALRRIRCVEYTLHETFPDRVRTVCERGRGREAFALSSSGWGTFTVRIRAILDSGRVQELTHPLRFPAR